MPRSLVLAAFLSAGWSFGCAAPAPQPGALDWNRYYDTAETHAILRAYAARYPGLTELFSNKQWPEESGQAMSR